MLHLYQELTLLALKDEKGTLSIYNFPHVAGCALLAELILENRLTVEDSKKKLVTLASDQPLGDPLLDEALQLVTSAKKRRRIADWISKFSRTKNILQRSANSLCDLGILRQAEGKVLFVFSRKVFPEVNPKPEKQIIARLEKTIFGDSETVSPRDTILLSLADAAGLLDPIFTCKRLRPQRKRIKRIVAGDLVGQVSREITAAIQAAIIVSAVVVPTVATS